MSNFNWQFFNCSPQRRHPKPSSNSYFPRTAIFAGERNAVVTAAVGNGMPYFFS